MAPSSSLELEQEHDDKFHHPHNSFRIKWSQTNSKLIVFGLLQAVAFMVAGAFLQANHDHFLERRAYTTTTSVTTAATADADDTLHKADNLPLKEFYEHLQPLSHPSYCPNARCINTDLCQPCRRRFLFIISSGRSGSTTLEYMMDSLPGVRMSGENNDALGQLRKLFQHTIYGPHFRLPGTDTDKQDAWSHNPIPPQTQACVAQKMVETLNPPKLIQFQKIQDPEGAASDIIGFKTIRFLIDVETEYPGKQYEENLVKFMKRNFPCSKIIVNINSDIEYQATEYTNRHFLAKSGWTREMYRKMLTVTDAMMKRFVENMGPDRAFLLDKVEWTQDVSRINEVVSWLGFHKSCYFEKLLEFNTAGYSNGDTKVPLHPNCTKI